MFFKISVLKNFAKFTGKHQYQSISLIKLQTFSLHLCLYLCFFWEFLEIFNVLKNFYRASPDNQLWQGNYSENFEKIFEKYLWWNPPFIKMQGVRYITKNSYRFNKTHRKTFVSKSLFKKGCRLKSCNFIRKRFLQRFFLWISWNC